jgi:hypothetical protein
VFGRFDLMRQYLEVERVSFDRMIDPTTTIGVVGIPLVDMSEPLSRGICSNPRLADLRREPPRRCGRICWRAPVVTVVTELYAPVMIP